MNVNGVAGYSQLNAYNAYSSATKNTKSEEPNEASAVDSGAAAVYEKGSDAEASGKVTNKTYKPNTALIEQLKADQEARQNQLLSYVHETLMGQGNALATSNDDVWKFLASGNYTVTEAAKVEAQKAIGEGGYWSAEKTSDRIVEFAKALTGGDPSQIEKMRSAIDKGFKEATKAWGKELPSITNDTYDLIQKKLDTWANESKKNDATSNENVANAASAVNADVTASTI